MKCLRCGYCCKYYFVAIPDDPELGTKKDNIIVNEGNGSPCKHLRGDRAGEYSCAIHDKSWYKQTPCYEFGQIEKSKNEECRIGRFILDMMEEL